MTLKTTSLRKATTTWW